MWWGDKKHDDDDNDVGKRVGCPEWKGVEERTRGGQGGTLSMFFFGTLFLLLSMLSPYKSVVVGCSTSDC